MRLSAKLFCISVFTVGVLLAQGPPPDFGGPGGPGPRGMFGHGGPPVTGAPYSATVTDTRQETLTDGNQIQQSHTSKVYRDAEGRTRTESTMTTPSGVSKTMIMIVDPVAGFMAHLNPADSTAMKMTMPTRPASAAGEQKNRPSRPNDANGPQVVKSDLGASTIEGLAATGTRTTATVPAGEMGNSQPIVETREVWVSTALKVPVKMTSSDPRRGTSSMTMTNINQSAPEPALFQIPSGYTVKDAPAHAHAGGHGAEGPGAEGPGAGGPPPFDGGSL